jgi:hypothetical protein
MKASGWLAPEHSGSASDDACHAYPAVALHCPSPFLMRHTRPVKPTFQTALPRRRQLVRWLAQMPSATMGM